MAGIAPQQIPACRTHLRLPLVQVLLLPVAELSMAGSRVALSQQIRAISAAQSLSLEVWPPPALLLRAPMSLGPVLRILFQMRGRKHPQSPSLAAVSPAFFETTTSTVLVTATRLSSARCRKQACLVVFAAAAAAPVAAAVGVAVLARPCSEVLRRWRWWCRRCWPERRPWDRIFCGVSSEAAAWETSPRAPPVSREEWVVQKN